MTPVRASLFCSLLLVTTACTQPAAQVELKGQNMYAQNNANGYVSSKPAPAYASNSQSTYVPPPVYTNTTEQTASVQSITSSDLAAPSKTQVKAEATKPVSEPVKQQASSNSVPRQTVNPWTKKPREFSDDETIAPITAKASSNDFMWPVNSHKVISSFGPKGGGKANDGINIASSEGEPVWAAADGEVIYVGNELQGYGNMVILRHAGNKNTTYANLSRANVQKSGRVKQGDIIGYVGSTGGVKRPQLHFAIREGKDPVDPRKYLSRSVASN